MNRQERTRRHLQDMLRVFYNSVQPYGTPVYRWANTGSFTWIVLLS